MNTMNGFYFLMGCKDVFVKTEKKNKTVGLAKAICEKMGFPASQNNVTELIRRLQKATYQLTILSNGRKCHDIKGNGFSYGSFVDENNTIIIDLNKPGGKNNGKNTIT